MEPDRYEVEGIDSWRPHTGARQDQRPIYTVLLDGTKRRNTARRLLWTIAGLLALAPIYWIFS